jgi:hypothetical protein
VSRSARCLSAMIAKTVSLTVSGGWGCVTVAYDGKSSLVRCSARVEPRLCRSAGLVLVPGAESDVVGVGLGAVVHLRVG